MSYKLKQNVLEFAPTITKNARGVERINILRAWLIKAQPHVKTAADYDLTPLPLTTKHLDDWTDNTDGPPIQLPHMWGVLTTTYGEKGSQNMITTKPTVIKTGKNLGKSNATNVLTQMIADAISKHTKAQKLTTETETNGRYPPLLVNNTLRLNWGNVTYIASPKLNGNRCVARVATQPLDPEGQERTDGGSEVAPKSLSINDLDALLGVELNVSPTEVKESSQGSKGSAAPLVELYSRTLTEHPFQTPIRKELEPFFKEHPDWYLDGELYNHGESLQSINSKIRSDAYDDMIKLYLFDCWIPGQEQMPYAERLKYLVQFKTYFDANCPHLRVIGPVQVVRDEKELDVFYKWCLAQKYEGVVIRDALSPYTYSYNKYHTQDVMKLKPIDIDDYPIVDYTEGSKGKDVGKVIWICQTPEGHNFNVVPNMSEDDRAAIFTELKSNPAAFRHKYKHALLRVEYRTMSTDDIPQQSRGVALLDSDGTILWKS